jgi:hypothetical protein
MPNSVEGGKWEEAYGEVLWQPASSYSELRAYVVPPRSVILVFQAVSILFNQPYINDGGPREQWTSIKNNLFSNRFGLERKIQDFDINTVTEEMITQLSPFYNNIDFTYENTSMVSTLNGYYCKFIRAIYESKVQQ